MPDAYSVKDYFVNLIIQILMYVFIWLPAFAPKRMKS